MPCSWPNLQLRMQGKDGTYGTSLRYGVAMDPGCDVMVCFMQNGRLLQPDHGFPVHTPALGGFLDAPE